MSALPEATEKLNRKLNTVLLLVGLMFTYGVVSFVFPIFPFARSTGGSSSLPAWDAGRPFGADFDGSREQRSVIDRAKNANGVDAAKIHLHVLNLTGLTLNEQEIETLGTMSDLRELTLKKSNVQDKDFFLLTSLGKLESLDLSDTQLTDDVLPLFRKFHNLRSLVLTGTRISASGVRALHEQMPRLRATLYGPDSNHFGGGIQATTGKYVLLKYGSDRIAFRFTEVTTTGEGGAKYVWHWQPDAGAKFLAASLKTGQAEVFEKYRKTRRLDDRNTLIEDDGGQLVMQMGPAKLNWSKPRSVYYPSENESRSTVTFAFTMWERLEDINFDDGTLKWYERTDR